MVTFCCFCFISEDILSRRKFRWYWMLEWLSWKSKRDAVLPIPISLLPDLIFAALAGSFLSDHLRETALPGTLSIPPLSEVISWICLPLYRPSASLWSSLQLESCFHIFCPLEPYSFPSVSICLLNFPHQPPQSSLYLLPLPSGSSPPPVPLVLKTILIQSTLLTGTASCSLLREVHICILSHPPWPRWDHPSIPSIFREREGFITIFNLIFMAFQLKIWLSVVKEKKYCSGF